MDGAYCEPQVLSCWAVSFGRAGYYGQTVECQVIQELDFHCCTFRPAGGDGSASCPRWLLPGFAGFRHGECCLIWDPDRRLLGYGWQHMSWPRLVLTVWHGIGTCLPVKAAGAVTSAGPAGSCQAARSQESRSTPTQPGGPKVSTTIQQTPRMSAVPDHNDLALTQNIRTGDISIAANVVYDDGPRMHRSRSQLAWWCPLLSMVCNGETTQTAENPGNPQQIAGDDFTQQ